MVIELEYRTICQKIIESDPKITYAFLVNSEARLVAFGGIENATKIGEERFAELMEDLLFMLSSRKHYEDLFGAVQFVHIKHRKTDTFIFPFERDKMLCVCCEIFDYDEKGFLNKLQQILSGMYKYNRNKELDTVVAKDSKNGFAMHR